VIVRIAPSRIGIKRIMAHTQVPRAILDCIPKPRHT
jgi:hypothetical protein